MRLKGKTIIVTGSAAGIGREMALTFAREGAQVLITDQNADGAREVADQLKSYGTAHIDDLADPGAALRIVEAAMRQFGQIDGLVNNAAYIPRSDIKTTDPTLFDKVMSINVRAPLLLIQAALPHLEAAKGSVLNIGSINAYCGGAAPAGVQRFEGCFDDAISQFGVIRYSPRLALESIKSILGGY